MGDNRGHRPKIPASTQDGVTVAVTTTEIVPANAKRLEATVINISDEHIFLGIGVPAVLNEGIRINAKGGSHTEDISNGAINGICVSGGKIATYCEKAVDTL